MPRPRDLFTPRSDHTQAVEGGTNVNVGNVRLRSELSNDESRLTFALTTDDTADADPATGFPYVQQPLAEGESRSLVFLEGYQEALNEGATPTQALGANQGPIDPTAGVNAVTTLTALSATGPVKIKPYIDGHLQSVVYDEGAGWQFAQIAELSELKEFANLLGETVADPPTIEWEIENLSPEPVECSIIVRLLGKEVDQ
jgi:hypothetical protein